MRKWSLLRKTLPVFPKAFQHRAENVKTIRQFAVCGAYKTFVSAHVQPQLACVARANGHLQVALEFGSRSSLGKPSTIFAGIDLAALRNSEFKLFRCGELLCCAGNFQVQAVRLVNTTKSL